MSILSPPPIMKAILATKILTRKNAIEAQNLTPSVVSPKTDFPREIHQAIIGGWS